MNVSRVSVAFLCGIFLGFMMRSISIRQPEMQVTTAPFHLSSIPHTGVSHNPEIKKQVLASYLQLPHITQVARASLKGGQVASENWHKDMAEMFLFVEGEGILNLDGVNHSVSAGSVSLVYPPTKHTIYNTDAERSLDLITIASIP